MQCDDVAKLLPAAVEHGAAVELSVQRHIESCLRCQAELARYRTMLRGLQLLRTRYLEPSPGLLAQTLAAIEEAGERQAVHSILSGRRLAYVGAIGGAAVAATAARPRPCSSPAPGVAGSRSPADLAPGSARRTTLLPCGMGRSSRVAPGRSNDGGCAALNIAVTVLVAVLWWNLYRPQLVGRARRLRHGVGPVDGVDARRR